MDEALLRKIFSTQVTTPREALYLESGNVPLRFTLMARRLNFLHYILNEDEDSLIRRVLTAQLSDPVKGDWITTVLSDLESLKINLSMEEIQMSTKDHFKALVKENMRREAFVYLMDIKASHSKTKNLVYDKLSVQDYLTSDSPLTLKEKKFVFSARCRMTEVRCNFKTGKTDFKCRKCNKEEESQITGASAEVS